MSNSGKIILTILTFSFFSIIVYVFGTEDIKVKIVFFGGLFLTLVISSTISVYLLKDLIKYFIDEFSKK